METRVTIRFSRESRVRAQGRLLAAIESLRKNGEISDEEESLLLKQRPAGLDQADQVVLEYGTREEAVRAHGLPALIKLGWEIRKLGWAGLEFLAYAPLRRKARHSRSGPPKRPVLYLPSRLVSTTLPHRRVRGDEFVRTNGDLRMTLKATRPAGLPYGVYPRLALMHLTTRALLEGRIEFLAAESATDFLAQLGIADSAGARGPATRARKQIRRLGSTAFTWERKGSRKRGQDTEWLGFLIAKKWVIRPGAGMYVTLSEGFFALARASSVPLDAQIVQRLRRSPLALDVYAWLTWRVSRLERDTVIPWLSLERQLGCDYRQPRQFRWKFRKALASIKAQWDGIDAEPQARGLLLRPCAPSVLSWLERHTPHPRGKSDA